jgi:hypothetical protein
VIAERALGAAIDERLYRLRRVHVLVGHEPARLVCADRQKCELERAVALSCIAEMPAFAVAGIADEINAAGGRFDHERGPQRHVAVRQITRRPMPRRNERHRCVGADLHAIVPIMSLGRDRLIVRAHDRIVAERHDNARAVSGGKPRQRCDIKMVVMRMRDQDDIDRRQVRKGDAGIVHPFRPDPPKGRGAHRPDRIEQNVEACDLEEKARMPDIGNPAGGAVDPRRRPVGMGRSRPGRPFCPGAAPVAIRSASGSAPGGSLAARLGGRKNARR